MSFVISPAIPFPNIHWFAKVAGAGAVVWDGKEYFEKLSYRNRYYIAAASGRLALSIPLEQGRDQRTVMDEVRISYRQAWQTQHWRTLTAAYNRSPYFSHYEPDLQLLFTTRYDKLTDFNLATVAWIKKQLHLAYEETATTSYKKNYTEAGAIDLRQLKPKGDDSLAGFPRYTQVFLDRTGFLPNLSILDLLFAEGPHAISLLKSWRLPA